MQMSMQRQLKRFRKNIIKNKNKPQFSAKEMRINNERGVTNAIIRDRWGVDVF